MTFFADPRLFNFAIMTLYGLAVVRWSVAGKWWDAFYWLAALQLVAVITWGLKR